MEYSFTLAKLLLFDLDGTLAPIGQATNAYCVNKLKELEAAGMRIAIVSGKPADYLCGYLRQLGLKAPLIAGENGTVLQEGIDLPPKKFLIQPFPASIKNALAILKLKIDEALPGIWYQPNLVGVTPFPRCDEEFDIIEKILAENTELLAGIDVYRHADSFDLMPAGLDKSLAVKALGEMLDISPERMIAIGDGVNDIPMFEAAGLAIGIGMKEMECIDIHVKTIEEALDLIAGAVPGDKGEMKDVL